MASKSAKLLADRLISGLRRQSVQDCARWAMAYRVMPIQNSAATVLWHFKGHPWLWEMHNTDCELMVGKKAAQMGFTEWALNTTFYNIDVKKNSVLYVLPSESDASDFSAGRFDPALELSPHLSKMFSDVKNVALKRAGAATLYVRGSRSRSKLKSIPVPLIVLDELEEMDQDNIPLVRERSSGQEFRQLLEISTPTRENAGIDKEFKKTTQEEYFFKCPSCSKMTNLTFPECLVITAEKATDPRILDSHLICKECSVVLPHATKSEWLAHDRCQWVPKFADRLGRGFHISQLYSTKLPPHELAISFLNSRYDVSEEQEFFNSKLGECHLVEGAQVTQEQLDQCKGKFQKYRSFEGGRIVTMGVDVGHKVLHVEIDGWAFPDGIRSPEVNVVARPQLLWEGRVHEFFELDDLMRKFKVRFCVIDSQPDRRNAKEFALRFYGRVKLCNYGSSVTGKDIHLSKDDTNEPMVTVDRTSWLDLSLGRFRAKTIMIPYDVSEEYQKNIKAPARIYRKDANGNQVGRYEEGDDPDHFAHSRNYAEIALPLAYKLGEAHNIGNIL